METIPFTLGESPKLGRKTTLILGNFDGVHLGHRSLVFAARKAAEGDIAVLLFDQAPSQFFSAGKSTSVLTSLEDKEVLFNALGVDLAYVLHVSKEFFALSPEDFVEQVLRKLDPARIVVGTDYTYGKGAKGTVKSLEKSFPVFAEPLLENEGHKISTQSIIKEIQNGNLQEANRELGRPYQVKGTIAHGLENGRKMGFPTANLALATPYVLPQSGVYLGVAYLRGMPYPTLINVGDNPTIGVLSQPVIEAYLEGFSGSAYGETLYLEFTAFLREEKKFASLEALREQMEVDKQALKR
jgi:riboflavin kinase/FMN adenylyltransferase